MNIPWIFHEYSMNIPWIFHEYPMNIPWIFHYHSYTDENLPICPVDAFEHSLTGTFNPWLRNQQLPDPQIQGGQFTVYIPSIFHQYRIHVTIFQLYCHSSTIVLPQFNHSFFAMKVSPTAAVLGHGICEAFVADLTEHLAKAIAELPAETLGRPGVSSMAGASPGNRTAAINLPWWMDEIAPNKM